MPKTTATKKTVNARQLVDKYQSNCDRINEIADLCEKEQRERTEAETTEYNALVRENQLLQMKMQALAVEHLRENATTVEDANRIHGLNERQDIAMLAQGTQFFLRLYENTCL